MNKILNLFINLFIVFIPIISIFVVGKYYPPDKKDINQYFNPHLICFQLYGFI